VTEPLIGVHVEALDVRYPVYEERTLEARELLQRGFRRRRAIEVHALKSVNLSIEVGEAIGVVGTNGSGKSTLLRCIAGLQPVDGGRVLVRGHAHLLGVGAALMPQLSGYRNIVLGGLAMGLTLDEIKENAPAVIEFSGIGDAIYRPLNTYSSGMKARLAFSIATIRVPDVLLIDEALAVGDRRFKRVSLARIREIREQANAVILVSHSLGEIRATCNRTLWLHEGEVVAFGETPDVLAEYEVALAD
jgi:teichoic acid transport system ATP-binding protein